MGGAKWQPCLFPASHPDERGGRTVMTGKDRCDFCEPIAVTTGAVCVSSFIHLLWAPCILPQTRQNEGCVAVGSLTCLTEHRVRHTCSPTHPSLPGTVSICHRHTGQQSTGFSGLWLCKTGGLCPFEGRGHGAGAWSTHVLTSIPQKPSALSSHGVLGKPSHFSYFAGKEDEAQRGQRIYQRLTGSWSLNSAPSRQAPGWLSPTMLSVPGSCLVPGSQ